MKTNTRSPIRFAVIVGLGSAGKQHLKTLQKLGVPVAVYDPKLTRNNGLRLGVDETLQAQSLESLANIALRFDCDQVLVVIATWAPSHNDLYRHFRSLGFTRFVIEKLVSDCPKTLHTLDSEVQSELVDIWVPLIWRYSGLLETVSSILRGHRGRFLGASAFLAGKGFSEFGVHFADLLFLLSGEPLTFIQAHLHPVKNTRSDSLTSYAGAATFQLGTHSYSTFHFVESAHLAGDMTVLFAGGRLVLSPKGYFELHADGEASTIEEIDWDAAWVAFYQEIMSGKGASDLAVPAHIAILGAIQASAENARDSSIYKWAHSDKGLNVT